ncbi:MAG: biotin transporter BioY [Pelolinea sp.]|nr:biotin transporter BioY [Pelolinea sp.]
MHNVLSIHLLHQTKIKENIWLDLVLIITGSVFVAVCAQLAVYLPFSPVPITAQTLAVLLCGIILGSRRGAWSMVLYLLEGVFGLPVFAGGMGGLAVLFGPTAGYLIGFIPAAFLVGTLAEKGFDRHWYSTLIAFTLGQMVIYFFGVSRLVSFFSFQQALRIGVYPFLIGDAVKVGFAMILLPSCWKPINAKR